MQARVIATGVGFTEGPVLTQAGEIVFTSIDQGRLYRMTPSGPQVLVETGGGPNGATEGPGGAIYIAQNGRVRPRDQEPYPGVTGGVQVLRGGHLSYATQDPISPNDLCFGPDGFLYVTDPTRTPRRDDGRLWRCNVETGYAELLTSLNWYPNGIGFGLEDDAVYVADTGNQRIMRFPLDQGRLGKPEAAVQMPTGHPDGFLFDVDGNIVVCAISMGQTGGEIQTYGRDGKLLDRFSPGPNARYTNVALGADRVLIITDSDGGQVLAVDDWPMAGLPLHPFRK